MNRLAWWPALLWMAAATVADVFRPFANGREAHAQDGDSRLIGPLTLHLSPTSARTDPILRQVPKDARKATGLWKRAGRHLEKRGFGPTLQPLAAGAATEEPSGAPSEAGRALLPQVATGPSRSGDRAYGPASPRRNSRRRAPARRPAPPGQKLLDLGPGAGEVFRPRRSPEPAAQRGGPRQSARPEEKAWGKRF